MQDRFPQGLAEKSSHEDYLFAHRRDLYSAPDALDSNATRQGRITSALATYGDAKRPVVFRVCAPGGESVPPVHVRCAIVPVLGKKPTVSLGSRPLAKVSEDRAD